MKKIFAALFIVLTVGCASGTQKTEETSVSKDVVSKEFQKPQKVSHQEKSPTTLTSQCKNSLPISKDQRLETNIPEKKQLCNDISLIKLHMIRMGHHLYVIIKRINEERLDAEIQYKAPIISEKEVEETKRFCKKINIPLEKLLPLLEKEMIKRIYVSLNSDIKEQLNEHSAELHLTINLTVGQNGKSQLRIIKSKIFQCL